MSEQALSLETLTNTLLAGAQAKLGISLETMAGFAKQQMALIGATIITLESLLKSGQITCEQAKADLAIAKNSVQMALVTEAGLSKLAAQQAVDDALDAVVDFVDGLIDIPFL